MEEHTMDGGQRLAGNGPGRRDAARAGRRPAGLAVLAAAAAVIGLAACSGGSGGPQVASLGTSPASSANGGNSTGSSTSGGPNGNPNQLLDEWAACMRKHGDPDQADPAINSNKDIEITMTNVPESLKAAAHGSTGPCGSYLLAAEKDLRGGQPAPKDNPAQDVKFAGCMRASGFPTWPDPTNRGTNFNHTGIDPSSPAVQKAAKACDSKVGIRYYAPGMEAPGVVQVSGCGSTRTALAGAGNPSTGASGVPGGSGGLGPCASG